MPPRAHWLLILWEYNGHAWLCKQTGKGGFDGFTHLEIIVCPSKARKCLLNVRDLEGLVVLACPAEGDHEHLLICTGNCVSAH